MYGVYEPCIFYGITDTVYGRDYIIDQDWIDNTYNNIEIAPLDIVRNYYGDICYGTRCSLDVKTGKFEISDEEKKNVEEFHKDVCAKYNTTNFVLGYYLVVVGDGSLCHTLYPNENDDYISSDESE